MVRRRRAALAGQVAVVTGASSGIGLGLAERLAAEGAAVVLGARRKAACDAAARRIRRAGGRALSVRLDVRDASGVARAARAAIRAFGRLDIWVNNAGIGVWKPVAETTPAEFDAVIGTNLRGTFLGCREAFRAMRAQGAGGTILNISSMAGKDAWEGTGAYSASKFGIHGLSRALADEGRQHGIRVCCLCPGMVDTPMIGREDAPERQALIRVEDVCDAAMYLLTLGANVVVQEVLLERRSAG
jgi:3-oxoacyl-[acyl-carrier protein] reductase